MKSALQRFKKTCPYDTTVVHRMSGGKWKDIDAARRRLKRRAHVTHRRATTTPSPLGSAAAAAALVIAECCVCHFSVCVCV